MDDGRDGGIAAATDEMPPGRAALVIPVVADAGGAVDRSLAAEARRFVVHLHRELRNVLRLLAECEVAVRASRLGDGSFSVAPLGFGIADGLVDVDDRTRDEVRRVESIRVMAALARLPMVHVNLERNGAAHEQATAHVWTAAAEEATRAVRGATPHASIAAAVAGWASLPPEQRPTWRPLLNKLAALQSALPIPLLPASGPAAPPAFPSSPTLHAIMQWRVSQALSRLARAREVAKLADIGLHMSPLSVDLAASVTATYAASPRTGGDGLDAAAVEAAATGLMCHLTGVCETPALTGFDIDSVISGRAMALASPVLGFSPLSSPRGVTGSPSSVPSPTAPRRLFLDPISPSSSMPASAALFPTPVANSIVATALPKLAGASTAAMARMAVAGPDHVALIRQRQESLAEAARQRAINPLWVRLAALVLGRRLLRAFRLYKVRRYCRMCRRAAVQPPSLPPHALAVLPLLQRWVRRLPDMSARLSARADAAAARRRALKAVIVGELRFMDAAGPQVARLARLTAAEGAIGDKRAALIHEVMTTASAAADDARAAAYVREMKVGPMGEGWREGRVA